ncbi:MAG TPA: hypothetical protein VF708_01945 [Pyrinomonadaceae bacterium]
MNTDEYRREFAAYNSALELAHYQHRAGFEPQLHTQPVYDRYSDLFTRDAIDNLKRERERLPEHRETERAGLKALYGAARMGYLEARAKELTDECARCESSARVEWQGESLPAYNVPQRIANEPNPARRHELTARWLDAISACDDLRAAHFESFHDTARSLGFDSYRALFTDIMGTDYIALVKSTDAFLAQTEAPYKTALMRAVARDLPEVPFGELQHADYFYFERMARLDPFFPAADLLPTYAAAMSGLGIRVEQQKNIHIDTQPRPFKNPRAACFRINPPEDVRLLVAPIGGAYDYAVLFHEVGHAQHFAWASPDLVLRHPEFVYAPDYATTEGFAFLFNHLFHDPLWLMEHRPLATEAQARAVARDRALLTMHQVRRFSAKLKYEIELHDSPQVQSPYLASTYAAMQLEATAFRRSPALYLTDVDNGFYAAAYLRAWAFEAGLREHLRTRHGHRWWAQRRAGDELIDLWNTSSRYTVEELARLIGFGEVSFDLLADTLVDALKED